MPLKKYALSLRCRLLQYAVFVGINGWHGNNIFFDIFCFIFQINLFFRYHVYFLRLQCILKQLSDSVFVICKIINVSVRVICLAFGSADNSYLDIDNSAYHKKERSRGYLFFCSEMEQAHIRTGDQSQSHARHPQTINGKTLEREHQAQFIFNTCKIPSGICLTSLESTKYDHVHGTWAHQRRATKFILALPFRTDESYKSRLVTLKLLPFCYWHEYLDILFLLKCAHGLIKSDILPEQIDSLTTTFNLPSTNNSIITYNIPKVRALCHQNSYFVRVSPVWNTLPDELRKPDISFLTFKACLCNYYYLATLTVFDQDNMRLGNQFV